MGKFSLFKYILFFLLYGVTVSFFFLSFGEKNVNEGEFSSIRMIILILFTPVFFKYFLQILIAPSFEFFRDRKHKKLILENPNFNPKVSVIIPAWNEEVGVLHTIYSILKSGYRNVEVFVINDGSTDSTHEKMRRFLRKYNHFRCNNKIPVYYKVKENGGKSRAINHGLKYATGEIVLTIDADSVVDEKAIANIVKHFIDPEVMTVAGNVKIGNRSQTIGLIQQLEYMYGFYFKKADSLMNSIYIVGGAAAAYRRNIFSKVGVFDEDIITEDIEMSTRIQYAGYKIEYAADAIIYTEGPTELPGLCKQRLRWKYGRLLTFYKYRDLFFSLDSKHVKFLTFFVLPLALFSEALLFFEIFLVIILYGYTFYSHDFLPLIFNIALITFVVVLQVLTDSKRHENYNLIVLAPIAWLLFFFVDFIEYQALIRSMYKLSSQQEVTWQRWTRSGVFES